MKKHIFLISLVLTILIFSTAMLLNYSLDFFRLGSIFGVINEHEIISEAYLTEESFIDTFGGDKCLSLNKKVELLKVEIQNVGAELADYGEISFFKKNDYDYLERKYFLLELKFLASIEDLNMECNNQYIPILFFYETDDEIADRQGYILSEISENYNNQVVVISIDKDYTKEPLIQMFIEKYNITKALTVIIADEFKYERLVYSKEIESVINKIIRDSDFYGLEHNFTLVLDRTGSNQEEFINNLTALLNTNISDFAKGDILLILGRVKTNYTQICNSVDFYETAIASTPKDSEERALIYETISSLGCGNNKRELLINASIIWAKIGNDFRAELDFELAKGNNPEMKFSILPLEAPKRIKLENISQITIGNSYIELTKDDKIVSQTDRVTRDWLSYHLYSSPFTDNLLKVFYERLRYPDDELLLDIGWHEGGRIMELKEIGLSHEVASGTVIAKKDNKWYAPDENGIFKFEVPIDKVSYPTTRFLRDNIAILIDTHGINTLVEQAIRKNATLVIGCCDHPGKIKAAQYLADKGINTVCFTDKYLPLILGSGQTILGSPPVKREGDSFILGDSPIKIRVGSKIIAGDVNDYTKIQSYYDTPARYFRELEKIVDLDVTYVLMDGMNQTKRIVGTAREKGAEIIGVRVYNSDDYSEVKSWLDEDPINKAILFHSTSYPFGYKLFTEFPTRTSFDDINPIFI